MSDPSRIDVCQLSPMKSGTTWLGRMVARHPDVHVFVLSTADFDDLGGVAQEASPGAVLYARRNINPVHGLASKLHLHNPHMKFVVVLRNPVDRLLSHWRHHIVKASALDYRYDPAVTVRKSLFTVQFDINDYVQASDFDRVDGPGFLRKSLYHWCLAEYLELFGPHSFLVFAAESLFERPVEHLQSVFEFCGVTALDDASLQASSLSPRNTAADMERSLSGLLPRRRKVFVPLTRESRAILQELFRAETQMLSVALGRAIDNDWFSS